MFKEQIDRALGVREHRNNVRDFHYCVKEIFTLHSSVEQLEALKERPDLDTICAHDYNKMKQYALKGEGLTIHDFKPECRGIKVPEFNPELMGKKFEI